MSRDPRPPLRRRPALLVALALATAWARPAAAQTTIFDPRFEEIRRASVAWDNRKGPAREVVDVVCLVPDLATFLDVVAVWDRGHYFPVLIDDAEYALKFLRAFRPARVVRFPGRPARVEPAAAWGRAVEAVGKAWDDAGKPGEAAPSGSGVPAALGPVPPGVVVSAPESPTLAAAVALAAGHFQPLLKWEPPRRYADILSADDARTQALSLETLIAGRCPRYDQLGDDCDFVTLAGDYPYRYAGANGVNAFDDLILRPAGNPRRWGFAGRITGDPTRGAYQAMCSLFLRPTSALLFNAYAQKDKPWTEYAMGDALTRLAPVLKTSLRSGDLATLPGWHQAFDPVNPYGLLLINTSGSPTAFNLDGGPGQTSDVPETGPTAVLIIHSYSAESPDDPETIAGRWLANGAFAYYGSVSEPYLQAFRPPGLVASFLSENLPVVTAARRTPAEPGGAPWRLLYLGDPLYRLKGPAGAPGRLAAWPPVASWPAYGEYRQPGPDEPDALRFTWALKTAVFLTQTGTPPGQKLDLPGALLGIARDRLDPGLRPVYDDLLVDTLTQARRAPELIDRLTRIAPADRSASVRRHLETAQTAALQRAASARNLRQAMTLWADVVRAPGSRDFVPTFTQRVAGLAADNPVRLSDWRGRLLSSLQAKPDPANLAVIRAELIRVLDKLGAAKTR